MKTLLILKKQVYLGLAVLALSALTACGSDKKSDDNSAKQPKTEQADNTSQQGGEVQSPNATNNQQSSKIHEIKSEDGTLVGKIIIDGVDMSFEYAGNIFSCKIKGEKHKYINNGEEVVIVKHSEAGKFKLKTPDGTLLWKVKIKADKLKISDNEEGENAYEIKLSNAEKAKVKRNDQELGHIKLKDGKLKIEAGKKIYTINGNRISLAYGALAAGDISERDQYIIMTELLALGE